MRTRRTCLAIGLAALLACTVSQAAEAETPTPREKNQGASVRIWHAEWDHPTPESGAGGSTGDLGSGPMWFGYYDYGFGPWIVGGALGYGNEWTGDELESGGDNAERTDIQVSLARSFGSWYAGVAYHWIDTDAGTAIANVECSFEGPELIVGGGLPLGDSRFSALGSLTYMPAVSLEGSATAKKGFGPWDFDWDGDTTGYSVDAGVAYDWEQWHATVGYRLMKFDDTDVEGRALDETQGGDEFSGFYLEVGYSW